MIYLYAILISFCGVLALFSGMSIGNMFIIGPKKFFSHIKALIGFKVDKVFYKSIKINIGSTGRFIENKYYFFINIKSDKHVVVFKSLEDSLTYPSVWNIIKTNDSWNYGEMKMTPTICMFTNILKWLVTRKMSKSIENNSELEDGDLDIFINTQLMQISRDSKLKSLLD